LLARENCDILGPKVSLRKFSQSLPNTFIRCIAVPFKCDNNVSDRIHVSM